MTDLQVYLIIAPLVLLALAAAGVWISGIYDDPRRHRRHPGE
ncbi:hypothetical protein OSH10_21870 [Kaistia defluvii]|nr:hypothetical protein [Kaistia defluvii]MCX5521095.1 hypothetical protein [Kaistia defluvii]